MMTNSGRAKDDRYMYVCTCVYQTTIPPNIYSEIIIYFSPPSPLKPLPTPVAHEYPYYSKFPSLLTHECLLTHNFDMITSESCSSRYPHPGQWPTGYICQLQDFPSDIACFISSAYSRPLYWLPSIREHFGIFRLHDLNDHVNY